MGYGSKQKEIRVGGGEKQMSDYLHAKTENVQKLLDNCLKKQKQELIEAFKIKLEILRDRILEAPIISGSVQDLRDHTHNIKDLVVKIIKEYKGG